MSVTCQFRSGIGWRMGWDPEANHFQALVGADDWSVELTQAEFDDFCRFARQLSHSLESMRSELMDEEAIACEASSDLLWMEMRGIPNKFRLSFILLSGRRAEGGWPSEVIPELLQALQLFQFR